MHKVNIGKCNIILNLNYEQENLDGYQIIQHHMNLYKKYKVEIFYHTPGKNHLAFTQQLIDRCPEGAEDILKESFTTALLTNLFKNLPELEKYEAIQVSRVQPDDFRGSNDA